MSVGDVYLRSTAPSLSAACLFLLLLLLLPPAGLQAVLVQLQQAAQQLSQMGQELPAEAAQLLQEHQQLLASAQDSSRAASHAAAPQQQTVPEQQQPSSQQEQQQQQPLSLEEQQQQLDWESIIDFPHGSLRLLGGCKGPWMDSDPEWVTEKSYGRVECVDGVWVRQPLSLASVLECSILLGEGELRVFEQTEEFLEVTYQVIRGWGSQAGEWVRGRVCSGVCVCRGLASGRLAAHVTAGCGAICTV